MRLKGRIELETAMQGYCGSDDSNGTIIMHAAALSFKVLEAFFPRLSAESGANNNGRDDCCGGHNVKLITGFAIIPTRLPPPACDRYINEVIAIC